MTYQTMDSPYVELPSYDTKTVVLTKVDDISIGIKDEGKIENEDKFIEELQEKHKKARKAINKNCMDVSDEELADIYERARKRNEEVDEDDDKEYDEFIKIEEAKRVYTYISNKAIPIYLFFFFNIFNRFLDYTECEQWENSFKLGLWMSIFNMAFVGIDEIYFYEGTYLKQVLEQTVVWKILITLLNSVTIFYYIYFGAKMNDTCKNIHKYNFWWMMCCYIFLVIVPSWKILSRKDKFTREYDKIR
jgi:hypothetical protein